MRGTQLAVHAVDGQSVNTRTPSTIHAVKDVDAKTQSYVLQILQLHCGSKSLPLCSIVRVAVCGSSESRGARRCPGTAPSALVVLQQYRAAAAEQRNTLCRISEPQTPAVLPRALARCTWLLCPLTLSCLLLSLSLPPSLSPLPPLLPPFSVPPLQVSTSTSSLPFSSSSSTPAA